MKEGDKVSFTHPKKGKIEGVLIQIKRKKVIVKDKNNRTYDISKDLIDAGSRAEALSTSLKAAEETIKKTLKKIEKPKSVVEALKGAEDTIAETLGQIEGPKQEAPDFFDYRKCRMCALTDPKKVKDDQVWCTKDKVYKKKDDSCGNWLI